MIQNSNIIACPSGPTIQTVSVKKLNTLNYPILFGYFGDLAIFSRILHEHKILSEHSYSILHLVMVSLLLCTELDIAKFLQKKVRKYSNFMKYLRKEVPEVSK